MKTWEAGVNWTPEVLREWLSKNNGVTLTWLSQTMGKGAGYLNRCIDRRRIAPSVLKQLVTLTDIPESRYTEHDSKAVIEAIEKKDIRNQINESRISWREFHGPNKQIDLSELDWSEEEKARFTPITEEEYTEAQKRWGVTLNKGSVSAINADDVETGGSVMTTTEKKETVFVKLTRSVQMVHCQRDTGEVDVTTETRILYLKRDEIVSVEEMSHGSLIGTKSGKFEVTEGPDEVVGLIG